MLADEMDRVRLDRESLRFLIPPVSCRCMGKMLSVLALGSDEEDGLRYGEVMTDIRIAQMNGTRAGRGCRPTFHRPH